MTGLQPSSPSVYQRTAPLPLDSRSIPSGSDGSFKRTNSEDVCNVIDQPKLALHSSKRAAEATEGKFMKAVQ